MSLPYAVIIAGGQGQRLGGVRKADLRIAGKRLMDRVTESLGPMAPPLMVATGSSGAQLRLPAGAVGIPDLDVPLGGPLAGLVAAVDALQSQGIGAGLLVSVAVDTPFLPNDFIAVLSQRLGSASVAHATWGEQFYPPNAIWRLESLADLVAEVRSGAAPHSLKALQHRLAGVAVDWAERTSTDPFANINAVADLVSLGREAARRGLSPLIHTLGN